MFNARVVISSGALLLVASQIACVPVLDEATDHECRLKAAKYYEEYYDKMTARLREYGEVLDKYFAKPSMMLDESIFNNKTNEIDFEQRIDALAWPNECRELIEYKHKITLRLPCANVQDEDDWTQKLAIILNDNAKASAVFKSVVVCESGALS